ncbi:unnamed protein product (macronuclear) [Paramecium tetraurelia]|uniref:Uncharacterized protein n=1 Tax=Paramecium tetraurelia TaxID=5888 RepID=A0BML1_PARTE|nr:uncharacterized protein GSPATT00030414001 [Paramecium tetraurelia]CAK59778.1 unnamed protein product [Paramecium tetraurelia]|eukprot:XP_001427176.1 hypothetical protein (macronuclear) [Paramecium tetraurelia strain d4-2]
MKVEVYQSNLNIIQDSYLCSTKMLFHALIAILVHNQKEQSSKLSSKLEEPKQMLIQRRF